MYSMPKVGRIGRLGLYAERVHCQGALADSRMRYAARDRVKGRTQMQLMQDTS